MSMYETGTVTGVAGATTIIGTGTAWTNRKFGISPASTIAIFSPGKVDLYAISRVDSDTQLTVTRSITAGFSNSAYGILVAETQIITYWANQLTAALAYTQDTMSALNRIMTEDGTVTVTAPNGQDVTISSFKKMTSDISNKLDTGATQPQFIWGIELKNPENGRLGYIGSSSAALGSGVVYLINREAGKSLELHDDGTLSYGGKSSSVLVDGSACTFPRTTTRTVDFDQARVGWDVVSSVTANAPTTGVNIYGTVFTWSDQGHRNLTNVPAAAAGEWWKQTFYDTSGRMFHRFRTNATAWSAWQPIYNGFNTTKASDGTLKASSPVVRVFSNGDFEYTDEADGISVTRQDVGVYLIEGCTGLNADAAWGGIDGGFDVPTDRNKQPLLWLDYDVLADGSVVVKTYHRTHPGAPEWAQNNIDGFSDGDPIDIPGDQFVSVRVEMPPQSIWNTRQQEIYGGDI